MGSQWRELSDARGGRGELCEEREEREESVMSPVHPFPFWRWKRSELCLRWKPSQLSDQTEKATSWTQTTRQLLIRLVMMDCGLCVMGTQAEVGGSWSDGGVRCEKWRR